ncbi:MAG: two pore domain potassium channel family protein [Chloroflexi bacterium]|nr:two pore domain potassium channel family protein [Chloroflexota bacterium]
MQVIEAALGAFLVWAALHDVFQSVIVPRPTPSRYRPAALLVRRSWPIYRDRYRDVTDPGRREKRLGVYAPALVIALLSLWMLMLVLGFGLVLHALRDQVKPIPEDLGSAVYFAATSILTIGFGDFVAVGWAARAVAILGGASGLGVVALTITYLFSLYGSFQRREVLVVTLDERAGAPPSGVTLLETFARLHIREELPSLFARWEGWCAEVLESHLAYPILAFFRSTHDNESWVSALGAMLDAATLLLTVIDDGAHGQAKVTRGIGAHLVEDFSNFLRIASSGDAGVERSEFDAARTRLAAAGYALREPESAWAEFSRLRSQYASSLNDLARYLAVPPTEWIGDRSALRHGPVRPA